MQIAVSALFATAIIAIAITLVVRQLQSDLLAENFEEDSEKTVLFIAATSLEAVIIEDIPVLNTIVDQIRLSDPRVLEVVFRNEDGKVLSQFSSDSSNAPSHVNEPEPSDVTKSRDIVLEGEKFGSISVSWHLGDFQQKIAKKLPIIISVLIGILPILTLIVVISVHFIAVRPVAIINNRLLTLAKTGTTPNEPFPAIASKELKVLNAGVDRLDRSLKARDESERKFQSIIDNIPAELTLKDLDGTFTLINPYARNLYVGSQEGLSVKEFWPSEIAVEFRKQDKIVLDTLKPACFEDHFTLASGTHIIKTTKFPVLNGEGKIESIGAFGIDITEMRKTEQALTQSQKMEVVGQLTGGVAHDFNNLLGVMIGNTEMLEDRVGDDADAKRHIKAIEQAIDRASSLTNRLLAFSRQQPLRPEPTDLSRLISDIEDMLHLTIGETIELQIETATDLWVADIDPQQLDIALLNLVINARDAMPDDGVITITTENVTRDAANSNLREEVKNGDYVMVAVRDTGTGMPPEVSDKVFEPFFTTKEVGKGSGLGLSMVYGFVKQSNGHIVVESNMGEGTTVSLYLPIAKSDVPHLNDKSKVVENALGKRFILLVEDEPEVREITASMLRHTGYEVIEATDGPSALKVLKEKSDLVDVVFSDVVMPNNMSGIELAEIISTTYKDIKILLTSGYPDKITAQESLTKQNIELLAKPYKKAQLIAAIEGTNNSLTLS